MQTLMWIKARETKNKTNEMPLSVQLNSCLVVKKGIKAPFVE